MTLIRLLPIGSVEDSVLDDLRSGLASALRARCEILSKVLDPKFAFHPERQQYHSTEILSRLVSLTGASSNPLGTAPGSRLLGVTSSDLFIPILTFVFGEAQLEGDCALVSFHRLRQEFYGLPPDPRVLRERLLKEAVHELGHTLGLTHCEDYACAMAPSHSVEWIDVKSSAFCPACQAAIQGAERV